MIILDVTFDINLSTLFALLTGIVCGMILTVLIATLITLTNIKKENVIIQKFNDETYHYAYYQYNNDKKTV